MKTWSVWHWLILIVSVTLAVFLLTGLFTAIYQKGIGSGDAASWLQAIGSLVAIVVAIWLAADRDRNDTRQARETSSMFISLLVGAIADLRHAGEYQNYDLAASASRRLNEIQMLGRDLRMELLTQDQQIAVFEARAVAAEACAIGDKIRTEQSGFGLSPRVEQLRVKAHEAGVKFSGMI